MISAFAKLRRPLRLSELAAEIDVPVSSCYALARRLVQEGYLFDFSNSKYYYPTGKLHHSVEVVAKHDPLRDLAEGIVVTLRNLTNETATFGQRSKTDVIFLHGAESTLAVRMSARIGLVRSLHAAAMGKALLSVISAEERKQLLRRYEFRRFTPHTLTSLEELEAEIAASQKRGYFLSQEESVEGAMAVAIPMRINYADYGLQVAGPADRIRGKVEELADALQQVRRQQGG